MSICAQKPHFVSLSELKGMESVTGLCFFFFFFFNEQTEEQPTGLAEREREKQTFDFLLTFIKVTGIVSLDIFFPPQLSQSLFCTLRSPAQLGQ